MKWWIRWRSVGETSTNWWIHSWPSKYPKRAQWKQQLLGDFTGSVLFGIFSSHLDETLQATLIQSQLLEMLSQDQPDAVNGAAP